MVPVDTFVGIRIARRRCALGYSIADIASKIGVALDYLDDIEAGKRRPSTEVVLSLADALGVMPSTFFTSIVEV